ncbi:MAG TPA: DMT family transporter [Alphaproteobacteria bacterium]|nr:DMT family transporter [Alphaproteobacteria bacterium]
MATEAQTHTGPFARLVALGTSAYTLLTLAILIWSGNFVIGRWANLDVPPVALSFWRHVLAAALVLPFVIGVLGRDWPVVRARLGAVAAMSFFFVAGNTFVYFSILHTTVVNAALINAGVPVAAAFFSWLILRDLVNRGQMLGIGVSFVGIAVVVTRADLGVLLGLQFGWGDIFMLAAITCWALYMVLLKRAKLAISPWAVLLVLSVGGVAWLTPAYAAEIAAGQTMAWTWRTAACLIYVALFSTIIAWACWNAGTLRIGPNRASAFMCLHPLFGSALGVIFFDEAIRSFHIAGTVLVLVGVVLVSRAYVARMGKA